jgi:hypothetical protein
VVLDAEMPEMGMTPLFTPRLESDKSTNALTIASMFSDITSLESR